MEDFAGATPEKQAGEQFTVEDLLDFSNEDVDEEELDAGVYLDAAAASGRGGPRDSSSGSSAVTAVDSCSNSFSGPDPHLPSAADLLDPWQYEDLAELEWLSNFVEDSFSSEDMEKLQLISGLKSTTTSAAASVRSQFHLPEAPVPGRARSKRSRAAPGSWSSRLLLSRSSAIEEREVIRKTVKKEAPSSDGRRCQHCHTDKTPQWRLGPTGPKTLCNACGVRFKSGRLVPEYRPAASPTFVLSEHSNSHRKVLELRRQKEMVVGGQMPYFYDGDDYLIHHRIGPDFRQLI